MPASLGRAVFARGSGDVPTAPGRTVISGLSRLQGEKWHSHLARPCASLSSVSRALTAGGASAPSHNGHACGAQPLNGARRPEQRTILSEAWPGGPAGRCRQEARGGRGGPLGSVPGCSSENTSFWPPPSSPARVNTEPPLPGSREQCPQSTRHPFGSWGRERRPAFSLAMCVSHGLSRPGVPSAFQPGVSCA